MYSTETSLALPRWVQGWREFDSNTVVVERRQSLMGESPKTALPHLYAVCLIWHGVCVPQFLVQRVDESVADSQNAVLPVSHRPHKQIPVVTTVAVEIVLAPVA